METIRESKETTPVVAICGFAFRFPGEVSTAGDLWRVLESRESVTSALDGRWGPHWRSEASGDEKSTIPRVAGTYRAGRFGQVKDNDSFDASFFNINETEAKCMDRQQPQFLELTVEALFRAGIPILSLQDSDSGVWVGCSTMETLAAMKQSGATALKPMSLPGSAQCVIANRVSLFLG
ncbi:hypothetical protein CTAYLR_003865 [Chrysophaeum taylorii]|uniref:Beta-ketoacyl synthase-like N-terminal domain-containing protein n=1 Tax=Chrysophaeum taylorii TaxID=2483200 RepID=A0AAD7UM82_9STRA|nr:hypothetical protein CTAYLR_003865 [Chrysophaeum taylorii]